MADTTITIDGDTTKLIASAKKAEAALRGMGGAVENTGRKIQQTGDATAKSFEKSVISMGKVVVGARFIAAAFREANAEVLSLFNKMQAMGTERGGNNLRAGRAAAAGGLDQRLVGAFMQQPGAASQDEKTSLIESLSKADLGLSNQRFIELTSGLNSGAYSPEQIMEAAKNGGSLNVGQRLQEIGPDARREINTRRRVNEVNARSSDLTGDNLRVGDALVEQGDIASPGRAAIRSLVGRADLFGLGPMMQKGQSALDARALERTAAAAEKLANSRRLNVPGNVKDE